MSSLSLSRAQPDLPRHWSPVMSIYRRRVGRGGAGSWGGAGVAGILSGADLVYVAIGVPTYGFSVYVRPEIKEISDLWGKVLGVLTKGSSTDHAATALLKIG